MCVCVCIFVLRVTTNWLRFGRTVRKGWKALKFFIWNLEIIWDHIDYIESNELSLLKSNRTFNIRFGDNFRID